MKKIMLLLLISLFFAGQVQAKEITTYNFIYYSHNACFNKENAWDYFSCFYTNIKNWNYPIIVNKYDFKDKEIEVGDGIKESVLNFDKSFYSDLTGSLYNANTPANITHAYYIKKTYNNIESLCGMGYRDLDISEARKPKPLSYYGCIE